jgi:uncharacterized membrane-anchored protein YhcB (DUF1043 family)
VVDIALAVALGVGGLIVGFGAGFLALRARVAQKGRIAELEADLEASREELADYKREVYEQFGETAEKFRALNQSYDDLHRQLAKSAVTLIGDDAAVPLLGAPDEKAIEQTVDEVVIDEVESDLELASEADQAGESEAVDDDTVEAAGQTHEMAGSEEVSAENDEPIIVAETIEEAQPETGTSVETGEEPVPMLTEVQDEQGAAQLDEDEVKKQA